MTEGTRPRQPGFAFTRTAEHHARTLTAGSVAGMLFGVLFGVCAAIVRYDGRARRTTQGHGSPAGPSEVEWALGLLPFAGIFFLWFIGVSRQRLGRWEDRFISTIILGSGALFLAMVFAAAALAAPSSPSTTGTLRASRAARPTPSSRSRCRRIFGVYALRMAAVFLICQATAWLRHGLMPRSLALATYAVALVLLFVVSEEAWAVLVFPVWVFVVSAYLFAVSRRAPEVVRGGRRRPHGEPAGRGYAVGERRRAHGSQSAAASFSKRILHIAYSSGTAIG